MITDIINILKDPANALTLYGISAFFILNGIILLYFVRKKIAIKATGGGVGVGGNQNGMIVTGKVEGDVSQYRQTTISTHDADAPLPNVPKNTATFAQTLSLLANLSTIIGLLLLTLTFYLTFYSGSP
ncbi:MAG: hypothetical protein ABW170_04630 [Candidatus Thiodiazotropha sp. L084R]